MIVSDSLNSASIEADPILPATAGRDSGLAPASIRLADRALDWSERLVVLGLYGWLVARIVIGYLSSGRSANFLLLLSEGMVVIFLLCRRGAVEISRKPSDWIISGVATCLPLIITPSETTEAVPSLVSTLGLIFLISGMLIQIHAKFSLGRRFGCVPANRGICETGPYLFVRHPMYAGYLVSHLGILALNPSLWNVFVYVACYSFQIPRLMAEERLLGHDELYQQYCREVPYRMIPGIF